MNFKLAEADVREAILNPQSGNERFTVTEILVASEPRINQNVVENAVGFVFRDLITDEEGIIDVFPGSMIAKAFVNAEPVEFELPDGSHHNVRFTHEIPQITSILDENGKMKSEFQHISYLALAFEEAH